MKLRKLAAIAASAVLAVSSLAACGNDDSDSNKLSGGNNDSQKTEESLKAESIEDAYKKSSEMKNYTMGAAVKFDVKGEDVMDGLDIDDEFAEIFGSKDSISLSVNLNGKTADSDSEYTLGFNLNDKLKADLLNMSYVDNTYYINVKALAEAVEKVAKDAGVEEELNLTDMLPEGAYFKITQDMLKELMNKVESSELGEMFGSMAASGNLAGSVSDEDMKKIEEMLSFFGGILEDALKDSKAYTESDGTFKIQINNDNINDVVAALSKIAAEKSDEIAEKLQQLTGEEDIDAETVKAMAESLESTDVKQLVLEAYDVDVDFVFEVSFVNGTFRQKIAFEVSEGKNEMAAEISIEKKNDNSVSVSTPKDIMSDEDIETAWGTILDLVETGLDNVSADDLMY